MRLCGGVSRPHGPWLRAYPRYLLVGVRVLRGASAAVALLLATGGTFCGITRVHTDLCVRSWGGLPGALGIGSSHGYGSWRSALVGAGN